MKISDTFPDEIYTTRWRLNMAKGYLELIKKKAEEAGLLNDAKMQAKIQEAEDAAVVAAYNYNQALQNEQSKEKRGKAK